MLNNTQVKNDLTSYLGDPQGMGCYHWRGSLDADSVGTGKAVGHLILRVHCYSLRGKMAKVAKHKGTGVERYDWILRISPDAK